jgi:hypothetical protein
MHPPLFDIIRVVPGTFASETSFLQIQVAVISALHVKSNSLNANNNIKSMAVLNELFNPFEITFC